VADLGEYRDNVRCGGTRSRVVQSLNVVAADDCIAAASEGTSADWTVAAILDVVASRRKRVHRFSLAHTTMLAAIRATPTVVVIPTIIRTLEVVARLARTLINNNIIAM